MAFGFPRIDPTKTQAWQALTLHCLAWQNRSIASLFADNPQRTRDFCVHTPAVLFDYAKQSVDDTTISLLCQLGEQCEFLRARDALRSGLPINETENRQVLHHLLRASSPTHPSLAPTFSAITQTKERMHVFTEQIHAHTRLSASGQPISTIVNIGIGGSSLGPKMICEALLPYADKPLDTYFVSNVDGENLRDVLGKIDPRKTLFLVCSKTFTTQETLTNAHIAKQWITQHCGQRAVAKQFVALTTNQHEARRFGIDDEYVFPFWDFVGGRFSLWSAVGLSVALSRGWEHFRALLAGAHAADEHFFHRSLRENIPFLMAAIGVWNVNFLRYRVHGVMVYSHRLRFLVDFLQQLEMESNGKRVSRNAQPLHYDTCPVLFGGCGTDVQHSFFQLLHQGTQRVPCDFIVAATCPYENADQHTKLLANCFAQTHALMVGNLAQQDPFRQFEGNRPTSTFVLPRASAYELGFLTALYEHKVFTQGVLWNIYSFDQFGVELGKHICTQLLGGSASKDQSFLDESTQQLFAYVRQHRAQKPS